MRRSSKVNEIFRELLTNNKGTIYSWLKEMYPQHEEIIKFHYNEEVPFGEWFAFLFNLNDWVLLDPIELETSDIIASETRMKKIRLEVAETNLSAIDIESFPPVTVVKPDEYYRLVDGYHRYYFASKLDKKLTAYTWKKSENTHPNVAKIKKLLWKI